MEPQNTKFDQDAQRWAPLAAQLFRTLGRTIDTPSAKDFAVVLHLAAGPNGWAFSKMLPKAQLAAQYLISTGWLHVIDDLVEGEGQAIITTGDSGAFCNALAQARQWAHWPQARTELAQALANKFTYAQDLHLYAIAVWAWAEPTREAGFDDPQYLAQLTDIFAAALLRFTQPQKPKFPTGGLAFMRDEGPEYVYAHSSQGRRWHSDAGPIDPEVGRQLASRFETHFAAVTGGGNVVLTPTEAAGAAAAYPSLADQQALAPDPPEDEDGGAGDDFDPNDTGLHPGDRTAEDDE